MRGSTSRPRRSGRTCSCRVTSARPADPLRLSVAFDLRGLPGPAPADVRWTSDLDGEIGQGFAVFPDLTPGRHTVTVSTPDGLGGTLTGRGIIVIGG